MLTPSLQDNNRRHTFNIVEHGGLAHGILVFGGRVADIVARLDTTNEANIGVDLVRLILNDSELRKHDRVCVYRK